MIVGIGIDIAALPRICSAEQRFGKRFLERILSEKERDALPPEGKKRTAYIAGRWAAKEAAVKALGTGFGSGIGFHDVEILKISSGQPMMLFHGKAKECSDIRRVRQIHISISHEHDAAVAAVILEG